MLVHIHTGTRNITWGPVGPQWGPLGPQTNFATFLEFLLRISKWMDEKIFEIVKYTNTMAFLSH